MGNGNEGNLNIAITSTVEEARKQLKAVSSELKRVQKVLKDTNKEVSTTGTTSKTSMKKVENDTKKATSSMKEFNNSINKANKSLGSLVNFNKLYLLWNLTKRMRDTIMDIGESSGKYEKSIQRFETAFGKSEQLMKNANDFQSKLAGNFGLVEAELKDAQSSFFNILNSMDGVTETTLGQLSETLTKVVIDYSSMFGLGMAEATTKIKSAMVGETEAIRKEAGFDITEQTLGLKAQELGIERNTSQLSQMEKRLLRIIVLQDQMEKTGARGDFAQTINSTNNQLIIMKAQLTEIGTWIGNYLFSVFGNVLYVINGVLMAIKEIIKTMAIIAGFKTQDKDISGGLGVEDAENGVNATTDAVNKLKSAVTGIDELNIIAPDTGKNGVGSGDLGGVDPAILNALKEYDNLMGSVQNKAIQVRNAILDWLGYTYDVNENGEITNLRLKEGLTWMLLIKIAVKTILALLIAWTLVKIALWLHSIWLGLGFIIANITTIIGIVMIFAFGIIYVASLVKMFAGDHSWQTLSISILALAGLALLVGTFINAWIGIIVLVVGAIGILWANWDELCYLMEVRMANVKKNVIDAYWDMAFNLTSKVGDAVYELQKMWKLFTINTGSYFEYMINDMANLTSKLVIGISKSAKAINDALGIDTSNIDALIKGLENGNKQRQKTMDEILNSPEIKAIEDERKKFQQDLEKARKEMKQKNEQEELTADANAWRKYLERKGYDPDTYVSSGSLGNELGIGEDNSIIENLNKLFAEAESGITKRTGESEQEHGGAGMGFGYNEKEKENMLSNISKMQETLQQQMLNGKEFSTEEAQSYIDLQEMKNSLKNSESDTSEIMGTIETIENNEQNEINTLLSSLSTQQSMNNKTSTIINQLDQIKAKIGSGSSGSDSSSSSSSSNGPNPSTGIQVEKYATGGFPKVGSFFMAREAGAELVGNFGGRTGVVNNQQIIEGVSNGVYQAVVSAMARSRNKTVVQINGKEILTAVEKASRDRGQNVMGGAYTNA